MVEKGESNKPDNSYGNQEHPTSSEQSPEISNLRTQKAKKENLKIKFLEILDCNRHYLKIQLLEKSV